MTPFAEICSAPEALAREGAWRDLAARARPNPFAEFAFVAPALRRLAPAVRIALVWRGASRGQLVAAAVIAPPRLGLGLAHVWRSEQAALAAILVDRDTTSSALQALGEAVGRAYPLSAGWVIPRVAPAEAAGGVAFNPLRRAALNLRGGAEPSAKRRKEWARLERRLAERGRLEAAVGADMAAFERFLALEAKGWKGARGTALAADPRRAAFAREMAAEFLALGQLRVHALTLDGAPVAAGVELRAASRAFFWKIAYDEAFAAYSPGVLLTRALGKRLAEEGEFEMIDSCALPNHPMIDHVWPDRLDFVDIALPLGRSPLFGPALAWERAAPGLRERAKQLLAPAMGRNRS